MHDTATAGSEANARELEQHPDYMILRRIVPVQTITEPPDCQHFTATIIDAETTGLNPADDIIQIAMVNIAYTADGTVLGAFAPVSQYNEPREPIPREITSLTGITDDMVRGHRFEPELLAEYTKNTNIAIAHNARFDRPRVESVVPSLITKPWGCSMEQIDWKHQGFDSSQLGRIAFAYKRFFDAHNALDDVIALATILSWPLPVTGSSALASLLENARTPHVRLHAINTPFEKKDVIKARRRYHFHPGSDAMPKSWYTIIPKASVDDETAFLEEQVYRGKGQIRTVALSPRDRFSNRE